MSSPSSTRLAACEVLLCSKQATVCTAPARSASRLHPFVSEGSAVNALIGRDFSLVTLSAHGPIDLGAMAGWQTSRQVHVPFRADTAAERNLLGARIDAAVTQADRAVVLVA